MDTGSVTAPHYAELMWRALRRHPWLALALFLAVAGPLSAYALLMDPRYESTGTVWVDEQKVDLFKDSSPRGQLPVLLTILGSRSLAASVVDALPRRAYDELLGNRFYTDWSVAITNRLRRLLGKPVVPLSPREQVISELLKARMTFNPKGTTGIVNVAATASDPVIATDIATAYIETLQSKTRFFTREETRAVREFLEAQAKQVGATLREAEDALVQHERERGLVRIDDRMAQSLQNLSQAEMALSAAAVSEDIARTRLAAVKTQLEGRPAGKKVTGGLTAPPALKDLSEQWQKAEAAVAALTRRYTDAHPQVKSAKEEAQEAWARLEVPFRQYLNITVSPSLSPPERAPLIDQALGLAQEVAKFQAEREAYQAQGQTMRAGLGTLSQEQHEFARRRQAVETTKNLHTLLTQKAEEAGIRPQDELRNVRVLDPPSVPISSSGRQALKVLLMGLALGLAAALGVPVGLERLDSSIKTEDEAEAILGWPVLGSILAMEPRTAVTNGARARALPPAPSSGLKERA